MDSLTRPTAALAFVLSLGLSACGSSGGKGSTDGGDAGSAGPLSLATGFVLATRAGSTTGTTPGSTCTGFFPDQPNLVMTLENAFTGLSVSVTSPTAVALAMSFGASQFCGDGAPPSVSRGSWSAGEYQIFVGTTVEDATATFTVSVSE